MPISSFSRRWMLQAALMGLGGFILNSIGQARAATLRGKTIIVIGAGLSGLAAASALKKQGAEVVVIEARNRIGGRIHTDWSMGPPFEHGAGWIHGPSENNPTKKLADAVGAEYFVTDDENLVVFDENGREISEDDLTEIADNWESALQFIDAELETFDKRSLELALKELRPSALSDPGVRWAMSAFTEFSKGAPIEKLSATLHDDDKFFDNPDVVLTSGYDEILMPLAEGLDIQLSNPVRKIEYGHRGVAVTTIKGVVEGDYCICSVPLGVLKAGSITFDPKLPQGHQANIDKLGFGSVTKIALKFSVPFWDIATQYFGIMTEQKGRWNYWLNYRTFADENILLGISVGAYAQVADRMTDEEMAADALEALRDVWGDSVAEPTEILMTQWSKDPWTFGAYAYPTPGSQTSTSDDLSDPIEGRLFLCGEHTTFDYMATTHGAYISGLKAAKMIIEKVYK